MNKEDLEYLREMATKSETENFTNEELEKISSALRTNVDADDTTEALDLTAQIICEQSQYENRLGLKRSVDHDKLHGLAQEVIYYGELLGAENAIQKIDDFDFKMEVAKENVTDKNVNREDSSGHSFLEASLYSSRSPKTIMNILDKGGKFSEWDDPETVTGMLLDRVTFDYVNQEKDYGENSIKNTLGNLVVLIERGVIEKPENLDKLYSNSELLKKYPEIMKRIFADDKDFESKVKNVEDREKLKKQKKDYLKDKMEEVRRAVEDNRVDSEPLRSRRNGKIIKPSNFETISYNLGEGETGNSLTKEINKEHEILGKIRTEAAKKEIIKHDPEKLEIIRRRRESEGK